MWPAHLGDEGRGIAESDTDTDSARGTRPCSSTHSTGSTTTISSTGPRTSDGPGRHSASAAPPAARPPRGPPIPKAMAAADTGSPEPHEPDQA